MYQTRGAQRMMQAIRDGNPFRTVAWFPSALVEQVSKPVMQFLVPWQKYGVLAHMIEMEMRRYPEMPIDQVRATLQKYQASVDNRLGQLVYDNLFWNKMIKDLGLVAVRSLGWNLGTWREIIGGGIDMGKAVANLSKGQKAELTSRMAYVIALPTVAALYGATLQYLLSGDEPGYVNGEYQGDSFMLKDLYFPRTGEPDEKGNPQRVALPSYMKDLYHYYQQPGQTIANKVNPGLTMMYEMLWKNSDFYGTEIRNSDDPIVKQAFALLKYVGTSGEPFSSRGIRRNLALEEPTWKAVMPFVGVVPAPQSVNQTAAEQLAAEIRPPDKNTRSQEEADLYGLKRDLRRDLEKAKPDEIPQSLKTARDLGQITQGEYNNMLQMRGKTWLEVKVKSMDVTDALRVYEIATPAEQKLLKPMIDKKKAHADREDLLNRAATSLFETGEYDTDAVDKFNESVPEKEITRDQIRKRAKALENREEKATEGPEAAIPAPPKVYSASDISSIPRGLKVDVTAVRVKTGEKFTVKEDARRYLAESNEFIGKLKRLQEYVHA
jgi:hypothetical protein